MHILILEDNEADAELMKRELRKAGLDFTVQRAQEKGTFVAALEASAPDLILADYSLPGFDGLTALALARQRWADVPVIIVSGAIGEEVAIETLRAGATDYVLKQRLSRLGPVVQRALVEAREKAEKRRAEEALRELTATLESKVDQRTAELQHRSRQLQKLTLELSMAEERERRRVAEILHEDLQQQLAAIKFHVSLLSSRARHDPSQQALTAKLDYLLKDAIEKSRSLSHELSPAVLHRNDLAEALRWLANQMRLKHGLIVHVDAMSEAKLQSDALTIFLFRVVQELLFNVVKHARVGEARVRLRRIGRCLCLSVLDRGRGFDPQGLGQTTGLGLLSIHERIELLGGWMKIKSSKGKGSTFHVVIPYEELSLQDIPMGPGPGGRVKEGRCARGKGDECLRVLLVDDHAIVRQGLASVLKEMPNVEVVGEAANGREAVDLTSELRPDVVIMDVSMPVMSGEEATRQIKEHLPETRVIALSMFAEADVVERMRQAGADDYVVKSAASEQLLGAIRGNGSDS